MLSCFYDIECCYSWLQKLFRACQRPVQLKHLRSLVLDPMRGNYSISLKPTAALYIFLHVYRIWVKTSIFNEVTQIYYLVLEYLRLMQKHILLLHCYSRLFVSFLLHLIVTYQKLPLIKSPFTSMSKHHFIVNICFYDI